tara:strand:- start:1145 stop:1531 length:387 start_codon:yes stop_codon:yes gene_type:complete
MIFEKEQDLVKEKAGISMYVNLVGGSFKKLSSQDVDYKLFDHNKNLCAYAEVKVIETKISDSFPLRLSARKVLKLIDKRLNPVIIWKCVDGIIYSNPQEITGEMHWSDKDVDLEVKYTNKKQFRYVRA